MSPKWSFWLPLGLAAVVVAWVTALVPDPFGEDLTEYVQAIATIVLVAVTTSYVVATYGIAQTSAEQLALEKSQRGIDAVTELWNEFMETQNLARQVLGDAHTMHHVAKENVNGFPTISAAAEKRRQQLAGFSSAFNRLSLHIPEDLIEPGERLVKAYMDVDFVGRHLSMEVNRAIATGSAQGVGFDAQKFGAYWDVLTELIFDGLPPWDDFNLEPRQKDLEAAMSAFSIAARKHAKQGT